MDEGRKRVLLIAATILAARKLAQYDKPCPGIESAIANAVAMAEKIMRRIDALYPANSGQVPRIAACCSRVFEGSGGRQARRFHIVVVKQ
jgi:hypothetical protein